VFFSKTPGGGADDFSESSSESEENKEQPEHRPESNTDLSSVENIYYSSRPGRSQWTGNNQIQVLFL
jgi:hypothetical protein